MTGDTWHVTHGTWHMTCSVEWTFSQNFTSLAPSVWDWQCLEDIWTKVNDGGDSRTALAAPGLLIINLQLKKLAKKIWNLQHIYLVWQNHRNFWTNDAVLKLCDIIKFYDYLLYVYCFFVYSLTIWAFDTPKENNDTNAQTAHRQTWPFLLNCLFLSIYPHFKVIQLINKTQKLKWLQH